MPRPNQGFTEHLYVYVTPENKKFVESKAKKLGDKGSMSSYMNTLIDRARAKATVKKER